MPKVKAMVIHLIAGLIRNISLYRKSYYPEPESHCRNKTKVELYFSCYETKSKISKARCVDASDFAKKADLENV